MHIHGGETWCKATIKGSFLIQKILYMKKDFGHDPNCNLTYFSPNTFIGSHLKCCHYLILMSVLVAETLPKITSALWAITNIPCDTNTLQVPRIINSPDWGKVPLCYCIQKTTKPLSLHFETFRYFHAALWTSSTTGICPISLKEQAAYKKIGKG